MLGIEVDGYIKWILEVYERNGVRKRMNNWDCCFEICWWTGFKDMENVMDIEFYIWDEKHTGPSQERG
jgi:hypothetical protein